MTLFRARLSYLHNDEYLYLKPIYLHFKGNFRPLKSPIEIWRTGTVITARLLKLMMYIPIRGGRLVALTKFKCMGSSNGTDVTCTANSVEKRSRVVFERIVSKSFKHSQSFERVLSKRIYIDPNNRRGKDNLS